MAPDVLTPVKHCSGLRCHGCLGSLDLQRAAPHDWASLCAGAGMSPRHQTLPGLKCGHGDGVLTAGASSSSPGVPTQSLRSPGLHQELLAGVPRWAPLQCPTRGCGDSGRRAGLVLPALWGEALPVGLPQRPTLFDRANSSCLQE